MVFLGNRYACSWAFRSYTPASMPNSRFPISRKHLPTRSSPWVRNLIRKPVLLALYVLLISAFVSSLAEPPRLRIFTHGQSNPTYHVTFGDSQFVLRKKPPGKLLPSAHLVEREFKVIDAAKKQGYSGSFPLMNESHYIVEWLHCHPWCYSFSQRWMAAAEIISFS